MRKDGLLMPAVLQEIRITAIIPDAVILKVPRLVRTVVSTKTTETNTVMKELYSEKKLHRG